MKKLVTFILFLSAFGWSANAQIDESEKTMSQGTKSSLSLNINNVNMKGVEKDWKKYMKEFDKEKDKYDKKTNEYFVDNAKLPLIGGSANTVDIYVQFKENGSDKVNATFWFDLGGSFLNSKDNPDNYKEAVAWIKKFATISEQNAQRARLEEEEDKAKDLDKKLKKLVSNNEDLHKDIANWKEKIKKAEADIETNLKDQDNTKKTIDDQKKIVENAKKRLESVKY